MTDIATIFIDMSQGADFALDSVGLVEDDGLNTAVIISLFTDRRANPDDVIPDGTDELRGWWADSFSDNENDLIGSRLWLLSRSKQLSSVLTRAQEYAAEALQWLVKDGVAQSVEVVATNPRSGILALLVSIYRPQQPVIQYRFNTFWSA